MSSKFEHMSYEERMLWLSNRVIPTIHVQQVETLCRTLWRLSGLKLAGDAGFVFGETGAGKSTSVAYFADKMADELEAQRPDSHWIRPDLPGTPIRPIWEKRPGHGERRPLVVVEVNPRPRYASLLRDTALALNIGLAKNFDPGFAMTQIQMQLVAQQVKLMVFDDVQHITESGLNDYSAADVFKMMAKTRVQILCVGLETYRSIITKGKKQNKQLARLRTNEIMIGPLPCTLSDFPPLGRDGQPVGGFPNTPYRQFCAALDDRSDPDAIILPFDKCSNISHPHIALRIWRAHQGYAGQIMEFLIACTDRALMEGKLRLTPEIMADVYRERAACDDEDNWFLMEWPAFTERFETSEPEVSDEQEEDEGDKMPSNRKPGPKRRTSTLFKKR